MTTMDFRPARAKIRRQDAGFRLQASEIKLET
jgi:hypothetical protein